MPGHVHLKDLGQLVAREVAEAGGVGREFNTIAVDDGIAMGHGGMLYSLPSRELIADAVEYMVNAHCADALVCISNCDKITPGMLMAALRLNVPTVFVSGGPMEAGKVGLGLRRAQPRPDRRHGRRPRDPNESDADVEALERSACPTCGSCSGMFTANSMNCLTEALGLALPGNGSLVATHADREQLFLEAGRRMVDLARRYYEKDDESVLPRSIADFAAFENAMSLDIAMGGSTNTVLHLLAAAQEAGVDFTMADIDRLSRRVPNICKVAPSPQTTTSRTSTAPAASWRSSASSTAPGCSTPSVATVHTDTLGEAIDALRRRRQPTPTTSAASTRPRPAACRPRSRSARTAGTWSSTSTGPRAASAMPSTPTAPTAASPCSPATSPPTAASSRRPGSTPSTSRSRARPGSTRARRPRSRASSPTRCSRATWC